PRDHPHRRLGTIAGARARNGPAAARAARGVRTSERDSGAAQHVVQSLRRTHRHACARRLLDVPAVRNRCARRGPDAGVEARDGTGATAEGGCGMVVRKPGGIRRRLIMLGTAGGSIADLIRGTWRSESGNRWLLPLAVFLCVFGLVLILATTVEAVAPVIFAIC